MKEATLGGGGGVVSAHWPYSRVKTVSIFQTIFQFKNYFEFNSNLNFE
jgi:hypothetical protein